MILSASLAMAQNKGRITGKVVDAANKTAVDYATVSVFAKGNPKPTGGAVTDGSRIFNIDQLQDGQYYIVVNFMGYQTYTSADVTITQNKVDLGIINLTAANKQLTEVTVTAKPPMVENKIDKMVYNAANDLTSQGGVAIDILKKVPQVSVDIDGNVELQGNSSVRFLINGKPSTVFGSSLPDVLASLPASQIKSIEVITSPGAKYDAEGLGGIINIILKDNKILGINGNVNLSAGTRRENGSANLNIRNGNFGVSAFFSGNAQINTRTLNLNDRTSTDASGNTTRLIQDGSSNFRRAGYESGINLDWSPTRNDNFTGSFGIDHFSNRNEGITMQQQLTTGMADVLSNRTSLSKFSANSYDWSMAYKHKFKRDGQELDVLYTASAGRNNSAYDQQQVYNGQTDPFAASSSNNPGRDRETNISIDYTHPLSKLCCWKQGLKPYYRILTARPT